MALLDISRAVVVSFVVLAGGGCMPTPLSSPSPAALPLLAPVWRSRAACEAEPEGVPRTTDLRVAQLDARQFPLPPGTKRDGGLDGDWIVCAIEWTGAHLVILQGLPAASEEATLLLRHIEERLENKRQLDTYAAVVPRCLDAGTGPAALVYSTDSWAYDVQVRSLEQFSLASANGDGCAERDPNVTIARVDFNGLALSLAAVRLSSPERSVTASERRAAMARLQTTLTAQPTDHLLVLFGDFATDTAAESQVVGEELASLQLTPLPSETNCSRYVGRTPVEVDHVLSRGNEMTLHIDGACLAARCAGLPDVELTSSFAGACPMWADLL